MSSFPDLPLEVPPSSPKVGTPADITTHHAIAQLLIAYAQHVDAYEPDRIAELFAESCWVDYGPGSPTDGPMHSRVEVAQRLRHGLAIFTATSHHVSNVQVFREAPDTAVALSYVYAWHRFTDDRPDAEIWGQYHDRFALIDSSWLITRRVLHVAGAKNFPIEFHRTRRNMITE